ncbi:unnamed protein product [Echinostoma caproni]|uniref:Nuf2_DHR10-like domain-containing protein n=1 Tax=Echinostoma caproni TaxID=27848 RepID=A0A183A1G1_9TREM|nr:unnamed protein product [Echinostoma caproni]
MSRVLGCVSPDELRGLDNRAHHLKTELTAAGNLDADIDRLRSTLTGLEEQLEQETSAHARIERQREQLEVSENRRFSVLMSMSRTRRL